MKNQIFTIFLISLSLSFPDTSAQDYHVRIGVIGNSITQGTGLPNPAEDAYPAQLNDLLTEIYGDTCIVTNYGLHSTTLLKNGDVPYWATTQLQDYLSHAPEVCIILLGTNDSKPQNWDQYSHQFVEDYIALMDTILDRNPHTLFMLGYPPPAFEVVFSIRDSVIINGIIPAIDTVLMQRDAYLVDYYHPLEDSVELFPDKIHPDVSGALRMAEILRDAIIDTDIVHQADTGLTFITSFITKKTPLPKGDSTDLQWTTINADSVWLNGNLVESEDTLRIFPSESSAYQLIAKGDLSSDTIVVLQEVYVPELDRLRISPGGLTTYEGDTIYFQVYYYDQENALMNDTLIDVSWEISEGNGELFNMTENSAYYVAGDPETAIVKVSYGDISDEASITIRAATASTTPEKYESRLIVYPNPAREEIHVSLPGLSGDLKLMIYATDGSLIFTNKYRDVSSGRMIITVETTDFLPGNYLVKVVSDAGSFTENLILH